jgi:hypothetical protein
MCLHLALGLALPLLYHLPDAVFLSEAPMRIFAQFG